MEGPRSEQADDAGPQARAGQEVAAAVGWHWDHGVMAFGRIPGMAVEAGGLPRRASTAHYYWSPQQKHEYGVAIV